MRQKGEKTDKTRSKILAAAERLFVRYGFQKTTIGDICHDGRISRQTYYRYFPDKEELLVGYIVDQTTEFISRYEREAARRESAVDRIRLLVFEYEELSRSSPVMRMLYDLRSDVLWRWSQRPESRDQMRQILDAFSGVIKQGIEAGEFPPCNIEWTAYLIYQFLNGAFFVTPSLYPDIIARREEAFSGEVISFVLKSLLHAPLEPQGGYARE